MQRQLSPARRGAQEVHRHRLPRAAHADLLARRLRRAARGRGPRPGDPRAASWSRCATRSSGCASSSVDLLDLSRLESGIARAPARAGRPRRARPLGLRRSSSRRSPPTTPTSSCGCRPARSRRSATRCGSPRSCASCSTTRSPTPRSGTRIVVTAARAATAASGSRCATTAAGSTPTPPSGSSSRSTPPTERPGLRARAGHRQRARRADGRPPGAALAARARRSSRLELPG